MRRIAREFAKIGDPHTLASYGRYLAWKRLRDHHGDLVLRLRSGARLALRGWRPGEGVGKTTDSFIFDEIFIEKQYAPPGGRPLGEVRSVVDVGANVGFACVYLLRHYPDASAVAFEPHPAHVRQIRTNLELNALTDRVRLVEAAAGTAPSRLYLTDAGALSTLTDSPGAGTVEVPVVDWFAHLPDGPIDLLKMDIEGAEYPLMTDTRFDGVLARTRTMALEWHRTTERPDGRAWCVRRLTDAGFTVIPGTLDHDHAGILWAFRDR